MPRLQPWLNCALAGSSVAADRFFIGRSRKLAALATRHAVPTVFQFREFAAAGGLTSYGGSSRRIHIVRPASTRVGFSRARKPADLPVIQATKFELVINLKTAKALGLEIPPTLLARADEVIE